MELREGYKQTEVGIIPEDWEAIEISKMTNLVGDGIHATPIYCKTGQYFFINGNNLNNGKIVYYQDTKAVNFAEYLAHKKPLGSNTLLLSINGTIGNIAYFLGEDIVLGKSIAFLNLDKAYTKKYLFYSLQTSVTKAQFSDGLTGSTIKNLGLATIRSTIIPLPPTKAEQTAIATALSDVDALITQLEKLITKKRHIKQGAMQTLLNPFDENGSLKAGWEKKTLGDVCPNIRRGELITSHMLVIGDIPVIAGGKKPAYFHNKPNRSGITITISASGANAGFVNIFNTPIFASDCSTISESGYYDIFYIYYSLIYRQHEIYNAQTGGAQPHIHPKDLSPMIIGLPQDIDKQLKISETLRTMDLEITALETKLAKTKKLKQGMMQSLLTGQIRLVDPTPTPKNKQ